MSTATQSVYVCEQCGESFEPQTSIKDSFCSIECWYKSRGDNITNQIAIDHTHCSSCFAKSKEIDKPPEAFLSRINIENGFHSKEAIVGFQYRTPNVEREHGFTYCKCGNIDHYAAIGELRDIQLKDVLTNLWSLLVRYYKQDQFGDNKPDKDVLFNTLKASEMDFALAIGKAVYGKD